MIDRLFHQYPTYSWIMEEQLKRVGFCVDKWSICMGCIQYLSVQSHYNWLRLISRHLASPPIYVDTIRVPSYDFSVFSTLRWYNQGNVYENLV